jgi:UDP-glucose 4-epimerase
MPKAVVFGGAGFLGSHVADVLTENDFAVTIYDIAYSPYLKQGQTMIVGDVVDYASVCQAVEGCDYVFNFAGLADIDEASRRPVETVKQNILGNIHVLEAARLAKVKRYVYASTIYVFSEAGSFYRCSKRACEEYVHEYQKKYGLNFTIVRYGTLYGNRANERNSVYRYLKQAYLEKRIVYFGEPESMREYIHVEDAAGMSVEILDPKYENEYVILTGMQRLQVRELFGMIREILGNDITVEYQPGMDSAHYIVTPYSFNPKLGRKLVNNYYVDMGQGLIKCLQEISEKYERPRARVLQNVGV